MKTKFYRFSTAIIIVLINLLISSVIFAQAYEKISYQAVIRDTDNNLLTNQTIGMQVSILTGTAIAYMETHTPTTNANGLVSIEIGGGTIVSGYFPDIPWSYGGYSIKTEIDPMGGTNYTITATSQLLSVPFAINAKDAETALVAENVIVYTAGTGIDISSGVISTTSICTNYSVGDFAQGGIVFWIDETGQHGLVCAKTDQSAGSRWYAGTNGATRARADGPFSGEANTSIIIAAHVAIGDDASTYAARICNELQITEGGKTYGDWYLPSKIELSLMYQNKATINATAVANSGTAFADLIYWSSKEDGTNVAWYQNFDNGYQDYDYKDNPFCVRAIRAF